MNSPAERWRASSAVDGDVGQRIGLVLGAGGVPGGFFLRAAMAALGERTGWSPSMSSTVVGTSAGALNAARIGSEPLTVPARVGSALEDLAAQLHPPELSTLDRVVAPIRRFGGRAVGRIVPAGKNVQDYEVARQPFHPAVQVVSCRRSNGERRVTRLVEASDPTAELYASAAIPGVTPPVRLDGEDHVDGAVWSTSNADLVDTTAHDLLIVIAPMVPASAGSLLQRGHRAALLTEVAAWRQADRPVIYLVPSAEALAQRSDHEAFGNDARLQVLG